MAGWFGPRGNCGCCLSPPPPPPPACLCDEDPCLPSGSRQFSSLKAVIELDDSIVATEFRQDIDCDGFFSGGACAGVEFEREIIHELSGLSAANGTYDAIYLRQTGPSDFEEADPAEYECGLWFFPFITISVTNYRTVRLEFADACIPDSLVTTTGATTLKINTYNGEVVNVGTSGLIDVPLVGPMFLGYIGSGSATHNWTPYTCADDEAYELENSWSASAFVALRYFYEEMFRNVHYVTIGTILAGPIGLTPLTRIITFDGQEGVVVPFANGYSASVFGTACQINYESVENVLDAFTETVTGPPGCSVEGYTATRTLTWNGFTRRHTVLLNA